MPDHHEERLTLLERAQLLHAATLRWHSDMLDRYTAALARHDAQMVQLRETQERQECLMETLTGIAARHGAHLKTLTAVAAQHEERMAKPQQTLDVIKDMLERGNGH